MFAHIILLPLLLPGQLLPDGLIYLDHTQGLGVVERLHVLKPLEEAGVELPEAGDDIARSFTRSLPSVDRIPALSSTGLQEQRISTYRTISRSRVEPSMRAPPLPGALNLRADAAP